MKVSLTQPAVLFLFLLRMEANVKQLHPIQILEKANDEPQITLLEEA